MLGQIAVALSCGYLVKTVSDVGLNDFLLSTFARREERPRTLLGEVTGLKTCFMMLALIVTWFVTGWLGYSFELRLIVLFIATGFGLDGVTDSFFALCQARGRQDVEMRIRVPSALLGIGYGIVCVVAGAPLSFIALYKLIESVLCTGFAFRALGRNPFVGFGYDNVRDLAVKDEERLHLPPSWPPAPCSTTRSMCSSSRTTAAIAARGRLQRGLGDRGRPVRAGLQRAARQGSPFPC